MTTNGRTLVPAVSLLANNAARLYLTSATLLFVELLLIRWIPATVRYIGFFSNFLLMASFLGIGLGILLGRRASQWPRPPFAVLLFAIVALILNVQLNVQIRSQNELFFGLAENGAADVNFLVLPLVFILVTAAMATLAMPLGPLLRSMPPLRAYAIDIVGSMTGIALFTVLSAVGTNPVAWFGVVALFLVLLALGTGIAPASLVNGAATIGVLLLIVGQAASGDVWSPYYRISQYVDSCGIVNVNVNGIPHQALHPVVDGPCPRSRSTTRSTTGSRAGPIGMSWWSGPAAARTPPSPLPGARITSTRSRSTRRSRPSAPRSTRTIPMPTHG